MATVDVRAVAAMAGCRHRLQYRAPHLAYHDLRKWLPQEAQTARRGEDRQGPLLAARHRHGVARWRRTPTTRRASCSRMCPVRCPGSRVLINFFDGKRKNMTLGFPAE